MYHLILCIFQNQLFMLMLLSLTTRRELSLHFFWSDMAGVCVGSPECLHHPKNVKRHDAQVKANQQMMGSVRVRKAGGTQRKKKVCSMPDGRAVGTSLITVGMNFARSLRYTYTTRTHTWCLSAPPAPHLVIKAGPKRTHSDHREQWGGQSRAPLPYALTWTLFDGLLMPEISLCTAGLDTEEKNNITIDSDCRMLLPVLKYI